MTAVDLGNFVTYELLELPFQERFGAIVAVDHCKFAPIGLRARQLVQHLDVVVVAVIL